MVWEQFWKISFLTIFGPTCEPLNPTLACVPCMLVVLVGHGTVLTAWNYIASDPLHPHDFLPLWDTLSLYPEPQSYCVMVYANGKVRSWKVMMMFLRSQCKTLLRRVTTI